MRKTLNDTCLGCGKPWGLDAHEPYGGRNRQLSIKYGMVVSLCRTCHTNVHEGRNPKLDEKSKKLVREHFEKENPELDFKEVFK